MASVVKMCGPSGVLVEPSSAADTRLPASHQKFGTTNVWNVKAIDLSTRWTLLNSASAPALVDVRFRLNLRRDIGIILPLPDETWVEHVPGDGLITDKLRVETGIASLGVPTFALPIPPGESTPSFTLRVPGPGASNAALNFWNQHDDDAFNFLIEVFQVPFNGATMGQGTRIGSHEYKDVFKIDVDPPPLQALDVGAGGQQPRLTVSFS